MASPTYTKILAQPAHKPFLKPFLSLIDEISRREGWRESEAFGRWLEASHCALANPAYKLAGATDLWDANEARYLEVVAGCRQPKETMGQMGEALGVVTEALEAEPSDFLGPIFSEVTANARTGQFFSPWSLCLMMAKMTLNDGAALLEDARAAGRRYISLQEPVVGAGGMVLAASVALRDQGICPSRQAHWVCVDVDRKAVSTAYIQASLTATSATIIHGNTLSLEEWGSTPTLMAVMYPKFKGPLAQADDEPIGDPPRRAPVIQIQQPDFFF